MTSEEDIFEAAIEMPVAARSAYLDIACAGQQQMRVRMEALLRSHDVTGFMSAEVTIAHCIEDHKRFEPEQAGGLAYSAAPDRRNGTSG